MRKPPDVEKVGSRIDGTATIWIRIRIRIGLFNSFFILL